MTAMQDYIRELVSEAPPLSEAQKDRLYGLLRGNADSTPRRPVPPPEAKATQIYRHFDSCGCLLYVGIAHDPTARTYAHRSGSWWSKWTATVDLSEVTYPERSAALSAERDLIVGEAPVFNSVHAIDQRTSIIRYLIEHERWEHLSVASAAVASDALPDLLRTLLGAGLLGGVMWHKESQR